LCELEVRFSIRALDARGLATPLKPRTPSRADQAVPQALECNDALPFAHTAEIISNSWRLWRRDEGLRSNTGSVIAGPGRSTGSRRTDWINPFSYAEFISTRGAFVRRDGAPQNTMGFRQKTRSPSALWE